MKVVVLIVRLLLELGFLVFGLNAFLQFLKGHCQLKRDEGCPMD